MKYKLHTIYFLVLLFGACRGNIVEVKNSNQGLLKASLQLGVTETKIVELDEYTAPAPDYTQLFNGSDGLLYFTFLNNYNNSIYFCNYATGKLVKRITYNKKKSKELSGVTAYYIKSLDSIYLFTPRTTELILTNEGGNVLNKISLKENTTDLNWFLRYPQYFPRTVTPFIETNRGLLLAGFFFGSIPESIVSDFKFTSQLDFKTNKLKFSNNYPASLYGSGYNWDGGLFTEVYYDLHPDGDKLVLSFPVSHDLYISDLNKEGYTKVYGGSNFAGVISSINNSSTKTPREEILTNILQKDEYTAIKYDPFRYVYYRFVLKSVKSDDIKDWKRKPIAIIIMDKNFKYLGETVIGNGEEWNWQNSFVTREGLNVEYIGNKNDESHLTLKIFNLKKI